MTTSQDTAPRTDGALVALDWGTSSLRAWLLDDAGRVLDHRASAQGIRKVPDREFARVFAATLDGWPTGLPAIACGMIGSRNGWKEAPYVDAPADAASLAAALAPVPGVPHAASFAIVPGVRVDTRHDDPDVMRGEETQLVGVHTDGVAVLPGTHSKWARVAGGRIEAFSTWMTGDAWNALLNGTILGAFGTTPPAEPRWAAFDRGVDRIVAGNDFLHALFSARARVLEGRMDASDVPDYLSGLVIGEELRGARAAGWLDAPAAGPGAAGCSPDRVPAEPLLIGEPALVERYARALSRLGHGSRAASADAALHGLVAIARMAGLIDSLSKESAP